MESFKFGDVDTGCSDMSELFKTPQEQQFDALVDIAWQQEHTPRIPQTYEEMQQAYRANDAREMESLGITCPLEFQRYKQI